MLMIGFAYGWRGSTNKNNSKPRHLPRKRWSAPRLLQRARPSWSHLSRGSGGMTISANLTGMWRLDEEALLDLDAIIDDECNRITQETRKQIDGAARKARDEARQRGDYNSLTKEQATSLNSRIRDDVVAKFDSTTDVKITLRLQDHTVKTAK